MCGFDVRVSDGHVCSSDLTFVDLVRSVLCRPWGLMRFDVIVSDNLRCSCRLFRNLTNDKRKTTGSARNLPSAAALTTDPPAAASSKHSGSKRDGTLDAVFASHHNTAISTFNSSHDHIISLPSIRLTQDESPHYQYRHAEHRPLLFAPKEHRLAFPRSKCNRNRP